MVSSHNKNGEGKGKNATQLLLSKEGIGNERENLKKGTTEWKKVGKKIKQSES